MLNPGDVVARKYRIERALAEGGMGMVFIAENVNTEKQIALKVLFPQILQSRDAVKKFEMEARVAARIGSAHIVDVVDSGFDEERGVPFLAMELLVGETLEARVERRGALPPDEVVFYMRQVASALDKAHGYVDKAGALQPIVHRDLKPENLFLTARESGEPLMKVLDFGIAKVLSEGTKLTQDVKGTPLYMAFEQAAGMPVSPRTDVWAIGLIAFYLLFGQPYWRASVNPEATTAALFGEILTLPLDAPSIRLAERGLQVQVPPGFDAWFSRTVAREPDMRYASVGACIEDLAAVFGLADPAFAASASAAATSMSRASRPQIEFPGGGRPSLLSASAIGGAAAVPAAGARGSLPGVTAQHMTTQAGMSRTGPVAEAPRSSRWPLVAGGVVGVGVLAAAGVLLVSRGGGPASAAQGGAPVVSAVAASAESPAASTAAVAPATVAASAAAPAASAAASAPPTPAAPTGVAIQRGKPGKSPAGPAAPAGPAPTKDAFSRAR